jgi:hypothetical protein
MPYKKTEAFKAGTPARQGFYTVETAGSPPARFVAEWREYDKKEGKRWWRHVSDDPTVAKAPAPLDDVLGYTTASKEAISAALARELTLEERIQQVYEQSLCHRLTCSTYAPPIPANRRLCIGDEVEVGMLQQCTVAALRDDGQVVIVRHWSVPRGGNGSWQYGAWHWTDVVPTKSIQATSLARDPLIFGGFRTTDLRGLFSRVRGGVNASPDYQRDYVWTPADRLRYLESLMDGRELGRFVFVRQPFPMPEEVLDGKQRLACLEAFFTGALAFKGRYWHELSKPDRYRLEGRSVQCLDLDHSVGRETLLRVFLELNAAGVPQEEAHLDKVRLLLAEEVAARGAAALTETSRG